jgi:hypothetical protein
MIDPLDSYAKTLSSLTPDRIDDLMRLVSQDVHFRDPFNDCHGRDLYRAVLEDMFNHLSSIVFTVNDTAWAYASDAYQVRTAFIKWTLSAQLQGRLWEVEGCSELRFNDDGLVTTHHDYWDAAAGLYERLPLLGRVLAFLRRRIAVD